MHRRRKRIRKKWKILAVDAAMLFLAIQIRIVLVSSEVDASSGRPSVVCEDTEQPTVEVLDAESTSLASTQTDSEILLQIAMAEAEGEGVDGKALVMRVVLNRVSSEEFPDSVEEVVFEENQFSPVEDGRYWTVEPDAECYQALYMVQVEGWDESNGALYFCRTGCSPWMEQSTEYLYTAGNHSFYK